jgi:uncharacterized protein
VRIGEYQELRVMRETNNGMYLADYEAEVLLPRGQCPQDLDIGESLRVFVYTDSEDRPIATTRKPFATVGEFAVLMVVSVTPAGAFLDWGIAKDLFCPIKEQTVRFNEHEKHLVRVYLDQLTQRVVCTSNIDKFLRPTGEDLQVGEPIKIMIASMGRDRIKVIINGAIKGTLFPDEWFGRFEVGEVRDAFVKAIRPEDKKVAVTLRPSGYKAALGMRDLILKALNDNNGFVPLTDSSSPEEIHHWFGMSKGAFKKLIGTMYREGEIILESHGIRGKGF